MFYYAKVSKKSGNKKKIQMITYRNLKENQVFFRKKSGFAYTFIKKTHMQLCIFKFGVVFRRRLVVVHRELVLLVKTRPRKPCFD